jgi:transcriptional regulator with PAS, ATPase and Fis domain
MVNTSILRNPDGSTAGAVETFRPLGDEPFASPDEEDDFLYAGISGKSRSMRRLFAMLPDIAASEANVLITGESGTGKDLFARAIHFLSSRRHEPYVAVSCAALAESLIESELFGHEKDAFTGATAAKAGRFEVAGGGTLFLDEIGELKPDLQVKLLRVLEQREFERVGATRTISMNARIISATHRDLHLAMKAGRFREDFFYRLRTVPIVIPPLRERPEDIPLLVRLFIKRLNARYGKRVGAVSPEVMRFFMEYSWPGNVRELERTLEYAMVFVKGPRILGRHLPTPDDFRKAPLAASASELVPPEKQNLLTALSRAGGRRSETAKLLGISRTSLWRRMKDHGLS